MSLKSKLKQQTNATEETSKQQGRLTEDHERVHVARARLQRHPRRGVERAAEVDLQRQRQRGRDVDVERGPVRLPYEHGGVAEALALRHHPDQQQQRHPQQQRPRQPALVAGRLLPDDFAHVDARVLGLERRRKLAAADRVDDGPDRDPAGVERDPRLLGQRRERRVDHAVERRDFAGEVGFARGSAHAFDAQRVLPDVWAATRRDWAAESWIGGRLVLDAV